LETRFIYLERGATRHGPHTAQQRATADSAATNSLETSHHSVPHPVDLAFNGLDLADKVTDRSNEAFVDIGLRELPLRVLKECFRGR